MNPFGNPWDEPPAPPPAPRGAPPVVDPPTLAADAVAGGAALLASGRYADLRVRAADGTEMAVHRAILECRCGEPFVRAAQAAAEADARAAGREPSAGAVPLRGSARAVSALLAHLYTERPPPQHAPAEAEEGGAAEGGPAREASPPPDDLAALGADPAALRAALARARAAWASACAFDFEMVDLANGLRGAPGALEPREGVRATRRFMQLAEARLAARVAPPNLAAAALDGWARAAPQLLRHCLALLAAPPLYAALRRAGGGGPPGLLGAEHLDVHLAAELFLTRAAAGHGGGAALRLALAEGRSDVLPAALMAPAAGGAARAGRAGHAGAGTGTERGGDGADGGGGDEGGSARARALALGASDADAAADADDEAAAAALCAAVPPPAGEVGLLPRLAAARSPGGAAALLRARAADDDETALHYALFGCRQLGAARALLRFGAAPGERAPGGRHTLLSAVCARAAAEGAAPPGGAGLEPLPLPYAVRVARLLLARGADPAARVRAARGGAPTAAAPAADGGGGGAAAATAEWRAGWLPAGEHAGMCALEVAIWQGCAALLPPLVRAGARLGAARAADGGAADGADAAGGGGGAEGATDLLHRAVALGRHDVLDALLRWVEWRDAPAAAADADAAPPPPPPCAAAAGAPAGALRAALAPLRLDARAAAAVGGAGGAACGAGLTPLILAVSRSDEHAVAALLGARAAPDAAAADGTLPLQAAVAAESFGCLHALLGAGADPNAQCGGERAGEPLLMAACAARDSTLALALLECGADQEVGAPSDGRTSLDVAVRHGSSALVGALLERGARPSRRKDGGGNSLLHAAVLRCADAAAGPGGGGGGGGAEGGGARGVAEGVEAEAEAVAALLLAYDVDIDDQNRRGATALHLAASCGAARVTQLLLRAGASLTLCDAAERSPLEVALEARQLPTLQLLLARPAVDINGLTRRGSTLLHLATAAADADSVRFLLSLCAHADAPNPNGETALHWAAALARGEVIRELLAHGAALGVRERVRGYTPLHAACGSRAPAGAPLRAAAMLLDACAAAGWAGVAGGIDAADAAGDTALHVAAREARDAADLVSLLVGHGASLHARNGRQETVLHVLAERGDGVLDARGALLELLTAQPLPLDAADVAGNTALHVAAFGGAARLAAFFVRQGAWVSLPNHDSLCPLDTAQVVDGRPLSSALLRAVCKPPNWVPDRAIGACQLCRSPFGPTKDAPTALPQRRHHCRHCGRCVCAACSPGTALITKFGGRASAPERVCHPCADIVALEPAPPPPPAASDAGGGGAAEGGAAVRPGGGGAGGGGAGGGGGAAATSAGAARPRDRSPPAPTPHAGGAGAGVGAVASGVADKAVGAAVGAAAGLLHKVGGLAAQHRRTGSVGS